MQVKNIEGPPSAAESNFTFLWRIYALLLLSIPFSVACSFGGFSIEFPSEPLMVLLLILLVPILVKNRLHWRRIKQSPLLFLSFLWLIWMALGIPWSFDPLVTAKYTLVAGTHWLLFAYVPVLLGMNPLESVKKWFNYYTLSILIILLYAWYFHAQYNFRIDASVLVARPFYFDHALLSTSLLLLLGIYFFAIIKALFIDQPLNLTNGGEVGKTWYYGLVLMFLLIGIYLSYSRAGWLSAIFAFAAVGVIVLYKHYFRLMLGLTILFFCFLLWTGPSLFNQIQQNQVESKMGTWWEQIISSANVTTDVSNLERLNRYSCAIRMFLDRPIRGFGTGTFERTYLSYQRPEEMTRISVTTTGPHPPGMGGGAHSEYFQALSEMGLLGLLLFLGLVLATIWTGISIYWKAKLLEHRLLALALLFGLLTYFVHALFNNFFHHSKIAILVWSSIAILVNLKQIVKESSDDVSSKTIA